MTTATDNEENAQATDADLYADDQYEAICERIEAEKVDMQALITYICEGDSDQENVIYREMLESAESADDPKEALVNYIANLRQEYNDGRISELWEIWARENNYAPQDTEETD